MIWKIAWSKCNIRQISVCTASRKEQSEREKAKSKLYIILKAKYYSRMHGFYAYNTQSMKERHWINFARIRGTNTRNVIDKTNLRAHFDITIWNTSHQGIAKHKHRGETNYLWFIKVFWTHYFQQAYDIMKLHARCYRISRII